MLETHGLGPELFISARIRIDDFDGTEFDTLEPSPSGVGVNEAYKIAIEEVFSFDIDALRKYEADGEHKNRTPAEIALSLAPNASPKGLSKLTNELVQRKLDCMMDQIGKPLPDGDLWPRPIPGFLECTRKIEAAKEAGALITTAIISAGHNAFIKKCYDVHGLAYPDIMVTDETINGLYSTQPLHRLTKPSSLPFWLVKAQWVNLFADNGEDFADLMSSPSNTRMVYAGDDPKKDAGLAANAGIPFVYIDKAGNTKLSWQTVELVLSLGSVALHEK
jgi:hypothetical protein